MTADEALLRWLIVAIAVLFAGGVFFATIATTLHWIRNRQLARAQLLTQRWSATLHNVLAGGQPPAALLSLVTPDARHRFVGLLVDYASRLRGEELATVRDLARGVLPSVLHGLPRRSPGARARDIRAIGLLGLGIPEYESVVVDALADPSTLVSATAVQTLCRPEYSRYADRVIHHLPRFVDWSPRFLGVLLARFGADGTPAIRTQLIEARHTPLRIAAAYALWRIADAKSADVAAQVLAERDVDTDLAAGCLRLIERIGVNAHAGVVRRFLTHAEGGVRGAAVSAIGAVGDDSDLDRLTMALTDASPWVVLRAARILAKSDPKRLTAAAAQGGSMVRLVNEALAGA